MREKGFDLTAYHKTERVVCIRTLAGLGMPVHPKVLEPGKIIRMYCL